MNNWLRSFCWLLPSCVSLRNFRSWLGSWLRSWLRSRLRSWLWSWLCSLLGSCRLPWLCSFWSRLRLPLCRSLLRLWRLPLHWPLLRRWRLPLRWSLLRRPWSIVMTSRWLSTRKSVSISSILQFLKHFLSWSRKLHVFAIYTSDEHICWH